MFAINGNFLKLQSNYLFATIASKAAAYKKQYPEHKVISLGIGDVTLPLVPSVVEAIKKATDEMADIKTFRGYGPYEGYEFLRQAIADNDYKARGIDIGIDEIFVSDGAKSDCSNILDLFSVDNKIAVQDPVYPVYVDSNVIDGRAGKGRPNGSYNKVIYMPCNEHNKFTPALPSAVPDIIYLCYPNNPTGAVATKEQLKMWVDFALKNGSIILYDSAYEAFISEEDIPHSIFEIEGAKQCAIEFRSFSKTAGFTGTRCAYTVIPKELHASGFELRKLWLRRQATKFNGVSYIIQRGAEAVYSEKGKQEIRANIAYYQNNARIIREALVNLGYKVYGGVNAPYIWLKTPKGLSSWEFFDLLLENAQVIGTPGEGFGPSGQYFFRLTAFNTLENTQEAVERIKKLKI